MNEHRARAFVLERRPQREPARRVTLLAETGARIDVLALRAQ